MAGTPKTLQNHDGSKRSDITARYIYSLFPTRDNIRFHLYTLWDNEAINCSSFCKFWSYHDSLAHECRYHDI